MIGKRRKKDKLDLVQFEEQKTQQFTIVDSITSTEKSVTLTASDVMMEIFHVLEELRLRVHDLLR